MTEPLDIQQTIAKVVDGNNLSPSEMVAAMQKIMSGECGDAQIGGLLVALRIKGETVDEVASAAKVMRQLASGVHCESNDLIDIVGSTFDLANV